MKRCAPARPFNTASEPLPLLHQAEEIGHCRGGARQQGGLAAIRGEAAAVDCTALTAGCSRNQDSGSIVPEAELQLKIQPCSAGCDTAEIQRRRGFTADIETRKKERLCQREGPVCQLRRIRGAAKADEALAQAGLRRVNRTPVSAGHPGRRWP